MESAPVTDDSDVEMPGQGRGDQNIAKKNSEDYFLSYSDLDVHELMLKDAPRTLAYQKAIQDNADLFKDRVVIDVGAGTGILSLFAAKAQAKHVYAIEASEMANLCKQIVAQNDMQDRITVIHDKVENATLPEGVKADIIISEWMGFYLLHESMLDSVIVAREKWLNPEGFLFPSSASLYMCPVNMKQYVEKKWNYWSNVYGFDFSPVLPLVKHKSLTQPIITTLQPNQLVAEPLLVTHLDMMFVGKGDLRKIDGNFNFEITMNSVLHGFALWFEVEFEGESVSVLNTGPSNHETHWQQSVMFLPHPLLVSKQDTISCSLELKQDKQNHRHYNICIELPEEAMSDDSDECDDEDYVKNAATDSTELSTKEHLLKAMNQSSQQ